MAGIYKTPGVYVEEIPKFPPSIAPVETAIPAFIGYTAKAIRNGESLFNKPIRIESIAEYEEIFGGAPAQDVTVTLDTNNQFLKAEGAAKLYLYDSLRLFYANGGGNCYILSVGEYPAAPATVDSSKLEKALEFLEQEDEPTLILSPDAVSVTTGPYEFQKKALNQCNKLQDRFTVCDLPAAATPLAFRDSVNAFRNQIGINFLKYGAAYGPWINSTLPRTLLRRNLKLVRDGVGTVIELKSLTTDVDIQSVIENVIKVENAITNSKTAEDALSGAPDKALEDKLKELLAAYNATTVATDKVDIEKTLQSVTTLLVKVLARAKDQYEAAPLAVPPAETPFSLRKDLDKYIASSGAKNALQVLSSHHKHLSTLAVVTDQIQVLVTTPVTDLNKAAALLEFTNWAGLLAAAPDVAAAYTSATNAKERGDVAIGPVLMAAKEAISLFRFVKTSLGSYEKTLNDALLASFGTYKELVTKAAEALNVIPPSGAVAGVYASVDRDRGVWKAPANVSLTAVIGPVVKISHEQQGEYNVDVNAGKSINIIRAFTGKGTLVWGARTLAGNDNEWRYVPVRRFFNFVEESVKKATEQFVFEPNDANTWVKVQAMIENFLTTLWRQGALQGIKPEHAFYVAVGLGKTMTALDILEGRMIIEIGMAAVRPAEFIILKFSHKMAES